MLKALHKYMKQCNSVIFWQIDECIAMSGYCIDPIDLLELCFTELAIDDSWISK